MSSSFTYYIFILAAIVVGVVIVKKITSCLFRTLFLAIIVGVLAYVYYFYLH